MLFDLIIKRRILKILKSKNNLNKKNMNKKVQFSGLILLFSFISIVSSCGGGGKEVETVKLIPVKLGKEFQYVDLDGKIIINPQFQEASMFRNGLALVKSSGENAKWGFIGEDGKYVIQSNYLRATVFSDGVAWVVSENGAPTCIDTEGEIKFTMQNAQEVRIFTGGLAGFKEMDDEGNEKWGFVDKDGKVKINAQFSNIGNFCNDKCPVSNLEGKWGFIDRDGKIVVNYQFDLATSYYGGAAVVASNGKAGLIDENGKYIINPQFTDMQNDGDLFLIDQEGKYGWADKDGKIVINPQFNRAFPFTNNDLAAVQTDKSFGYIDKEGKIVINPQFDMAYPFNGKLALVVSSGKIGFIDKDGKYVINPQFDDVSKDLVEYFQSGGTSYGSVETDFFNLGVITARVKIDAPEGISFNTSINEIISKFKKTQDDFNKYSEEQPIFSNEKITNDAAINFYIIGNPWVSNGYYDYNFNSDFKPKGFAYVINLSGKGYGKEENVKAELEKTLTGYTKDVSKSSEMTSVFKNSKQEVTIYSKSGSVVILIYQLNTGAVDFSPIIPDSFKADEINSEGIEDSPNDEIGEWSGDFGNNILLINIESIYGDGSVSGYNIVKNNRRPLTGFKTDNDFVLKEPGDQYWDGVFKFRIEGVIATGTWMSNNGKINREFTLFKQ
jgi:hypothetical protein